MAEMDQHGESAKCLSTKIRSILKNTVFIPGEEQTVGSHERRGASELQDILGHVQHAVPGSQPLVQAAEERRAEDGDQDAEEDGPGAGGVCREVQEVL